MSKSIDKILADLRRRVSSVSADQLWNQRQEVVIVDCRESEEVDMGMIEGAMWIPKGKIDLMAEREISDKSTSIVVYCASGVRSLLVVENLERLGFGSVSQLTGGIEAWKAAGYDLCQPSSYRLNRRRFKSQLILQEVGEKGQRKLAESSVLIIGCGGIGSPVALYLAAAGVGRLGLVDGDFVDESNLQRQILHGTDRISMSKVESSIMTLRNLNPEVVYERHPYRLTEKNVVEMISNYDVIVDGCDNFQTRYLVNRACVASGKVNISGSVLGFQGQVASYGVPGGACFECIYPEPPQGDLATNCAEGGVLGSVVGIIGTTVATEVLKRLLGLGNDSTEFLASFDAIEGRWDYLRLKRSKLCGCNSSFKRAGFKKELNQVCDLES